MKPFPEDDLEHVLDHTRELWRELGDMRLFITGGTGFFGGWLVETLAWARRRLGLPAQVTVLTRDPDKFHARFRHVIEGNFLTGWRGDVRDFDFPAGTFTHVILAAAEYTPGNQAGDASLLDAMRRGSARSLAFARQCGAQRVLLTSSGAVYGPQPPALDRIGEDFPLTPNDAPNLSAYARGKRAAEHDALQAWQSGGPAPLIARCFAFVGPGLPLDQHYAVGNFLADLHAGRPINITGDGTPVRSYLHAADLAIWLWTILARGTPGRPYNVGSDHPVSIHELAQFIAGFAPEPLPVNVRERAAAAVAPARYVPDIQHARRELGLDAWIDLPNALRRTHRWHRMD